jgi:Icc protein
VTPRPELIIVQLSDPHIGATWASADPQAALAAAVRAVQALDTAPDLVLVSGDLADHGLDAEYARARELLAPIAAQVAVLPGNHDDRAALRRHFDLPGSGDEPIQYPLEAGPLRVLGLDTTIPGEDAGALDGGRLEWLASELDRAPHTPTVLALHHPPLRTGIAELDAFPLAGADQAALAELVARHPQVRLITGGHVHRACTAMLGNRPVLAVPSTYAQARLTLTGPLLEFGQDPGGFAVHVWIGGQLVSHVQTVGSAG